MFIKIYVIDFEISRRARRIIRWIALPFAVFAGTAATVALANVVPGDGPVPVTQFDARTPVSATTFSSDFANIQNRLSALERQATFDGGWYSAGGVYCGETANLTGDVGGYAGAKAQCGGVCKLEGLSRSTAHMCTGDETVRTTAIGLGASHS